MVNTGTGGGTVGLNVVDNDSIIDFNADPLGGPGAGNGNFTGEVYTVSDLPTISINNVSLNEGNSGTTNFNFTVSLSAAGSQTVTVNYATADGTATAGSDYVAVGATALTFTPGQTTQTVTVVVNGDTMNEPNETFFVNLSNPTNAFITDSQGQGTIINDDATTVTFTVTNAEDAGAGSLRAAIASANGNGIEPDNITFDPAFFNTPRTITLLTALPNITGSLSIQGPGPHLLTVRRNYSAPDFTIFNIPASELEVSLSGLTISNGRDLGVGAGFDGYGGGIDSFSHLTLTNLHVTGNNADTGGGVALTFADGLFTDCTFSGNAANFDGAIFYQGDGNYTLRLVNNTISGNDARGVGGGIGHFSDTDSSRVEVVNSTIVNNTAVFGEGGVRTLTEGGGSATTTLRNTIIAQNTPANLVASGSGATVTSLGFNLSENGNGFLTGAGDQPTAQPLLGPLALNGGRAPTHALLGGSPALDKGVSAGASTDQRGLPRIFNIATISDAGDGADIGAVEMQALIVTTASDVGDGTCDGTCTLREAITTANGNGAGLDDITFETALFNTARTINLLTVLPDLTSSVTMSGAGRPSADGATRQWGGGFSHLSDTERRDERWDQRVEHQQRARGWGGGRRH